MAEQILALCTLGFKAVMAIVPCMLRQEHVKEAFELQARAPCRCIHLAKFAPHDSSTRGLPCFTR